MMRFIYLVVFFTLPLSLNAQWNVQVVNDNLPLHDTQIIMPFYYDADTCGFELVVYSSFIDDLLIDNSGHCSSEHVLVIDGYKYQPNDDFTVSYHSSFVDFQSQVDLGVCSTVSGQPIQASEPYFYVGLSVFKLDIAYSHHVKHVGNETHFVFQTANTDIVCTNGISLELIFSHGFE